MDQPAINYFSIQSGNYAVKKESYLVPGDSAHQPVTLSIYYHPQHAYNLDVMMQAMKDGLNYYSSSFGPYQYRQLRVVEFPESSFAQSFANTIAFSENVGFLTDLREFDSKGAVEIDAEDLPSNFTYFITLHEVAHQWWAHQILPAATEGANFLSESMSQYAAVMAVKQKYGAIGARKLMDYYSFRYLSARSHEQLEERPLERVMDQQYIYYNKGICVMYSLQKYLGEEWLNATLKDFVREYAFRDRPYVTTDKLIEKLKAAAPDSLKYLISDGLEKIVVYENELKSASYKLNSETLEYAVELVVNGKKFTYDDKGKAVETAMTDYVEIGILDGKGKQVGSQIVKLHAGENKLHFTTPRRPASLVLNPDFDLLEKDYNKMNRKVPVAKI
jgi:aminopeptidase N